ncbi:MAG: hypothetical protein LBM08_11245 [Dysgonamonadaceae bacterium]|jgi:hypothetical protein|nr:hypothetical protein [Dysgonamonadaceae bacterium]
MKKFFLAMFVVALTATSFSSCSKDDLTDDDLKAKILEYRYYKGNDGDGGAAILTFTATRFDLTYDGDNEPLTEGTWYVNDGVLILTGVGETNQNGTGVIKDEGKELIVTVDPSDPIIFNFKKK